MKNMKKLIPALAMLVLSAVMMSTASFAWFSMNTQVAVGNISVDTVAPVFVSIKDKEGNWATKYEDTMSGVLVPADTANFTDWIALNYNTYVDANTNGGGILENTETITKNNAAGDQVVYEVGAAGAVDFNDQAKAYLKYDFEFTLQNDPGSDVYIFLNNIIVNLPSKGMTNSLRVAVLNGNALVGVYSLKEGADSYYPLETEDDETWSVSDTAVGSVACTGVTDEGAAKKYTYSDNDYANAVELSVYDETDDATVTTLTVYVWFEGQDADCINSSADGAFNFSFVFGSKTKDRT